MVTVSLSMLSAHELSLLSDSLSAVGVELPKRGSLNVKFVAAGARQRSVSRSRHIREDISFLTELGFSASEFHHLKSWKFKTVPQTRISNILRKYVFSSKLDRQNVPEFLAFVLWQHFQEKLGLDALVEFGVLDFLKTCLLIRTECMEADVFVRFLHKFYDMDDYVFFQYIAEEMASDRLLSETECQNLVVDIFNGSQQEPVGKAVLKTLSSEFSLVEDVLVDPMYLVYITLWVFHHHRQTAAPPTVDSYIDSILSLKAQTSQAKKIPNANSNSISSMESLITHVLEKACRAQTGDLTRADQIMHALMTNSDSSALAQPAAKRDALMAAVERGDEAQIEASLWQFCLAIASASRSEETRYRN